MDCRLQWRRWTSRDIVDMTLQKFATKVILRGVHWTFISNFVSNQVNQRLKIIPSDTENWVDSDTNWNLVNIKIGDSTRTFSRYCKIDLQTTSCYNSNDFQLLNKISWFSVTINDDDILRDKFRDVSVTFENYLMLKMKIKKLILNYVEHIIWPHTVKDTKKILNTSGDRGGARWRTSLSIDGDE